MDQAVAAGVRGSDGRGRASAIRRAASTSGTGSSTTSGAPSRRGCGPSTSRTARIPRTSRRPHRGRARRHRAAALRDPAGFSARGPEAQNGIVAGLCNAITCTADRWRILREPDACFCKTVLVGLAAPQVPAGSGSTARSRIPRNGPRPCIPGEISGLPRKASSRTAVIRSGPVEAPGSSGAPANASGLRAEAHAADRGVGERERGPLTRPRPCLRDQGGVGLRGGRLHPLRGDLHLRRGGGTTAARRSRPPPPGPRPRSRDPPGQLVAARPVCGVRRGHGGEERRRPSPATSGAPSTPKHVDRGVLGREGRPGGRPARSWRRPRLEPGQVLGDAGRHRRRSSRARAPSLAGQGAPDPGALEVRAPASTIRSAGCAGPGQHREGWTRRAVGSAPRPEQCRPMCLVHARPEGRRRRPQGRATRRRASLDQRASVVVGRLERLPARSRSADGVGDGLTCRRTGSSEDDRQTAEATGVAARQHAADRQDRPSVVRRVTRGTGRAGMAPTLSPGRRGSVARDRAVRPASGYRGPATTAQEVAHP